MKSSAVLLLGLAAQAIAHGGDHHGEAPAMDMNMGADDGAEKPDYPPSYFDHPDHKAFVYAHIVLMTLSWVFALPVAVMLSLARSRYTLPAQLVFSASNGLGVFLGIVYNRKTPDLYPNNAHHKIGWIITVVVGAHVFLHLLDRITGFMRKDGAGKGAYHGLRSYIPGAADRGRSSESAQPAYRASYDSGHGTDRLTESLRSNSVSTLAENSPLRSEEGERGYDEEVAFTDIEFLPRESRPSRWHGWLSKIPMGIFRRGSRTFGLYYDIVDRIILPFGFVAFTTGIVTFARFFEGQAIFSGLAHWIKGGVFFWIGILTLGRWSGCFGDLGWAWNVRPRKHGQKWRPSSEFVESALIFFYGSTNIFLEHLGGWGGEWSAHDLEHISITVLFIGGGLCGMLIESAKMRDLLNTTSSGVYEPDEAARETERSDVEKMETAESPDTYRVSLNPIPALVIILLGIMMSSHTQHSMVSTMVHAQWGNLLCGAGLARGMTYFLLYLKPPRSVLPSRPPTELLASFGLIAGGIIFMSSSSDTVAGMENRGLDAMFMYTVTMGLVGVLMAWVLFVLAVKGWAVRKETAWMAHSRKLT